MPPKSVEIFGLPGSGKTTLAMDILSKPNLAVIDAHARIRKEGFRSIVTRSPRQVLDVHPLPAARAAFDSTTRRFLLGRLRQTLVQRETACDGILLYQEGLISTIWRSVVHENELRHSDLNHLLPCTNQVVYLDVQPSLAKRRIQGKPELGPINRLLADAPLDSKVWQRAIAGRDLLLELLHKKLGRDFIELDNSGRQDSNQILRRLGI